MSANIIQQKVKPNLTSNEKRRYEMVAEHFMRGSSDFYAKYFTEVKRTIDVDELVASFQKSGRDVIDKFKNGIKEKVDRLKENANSGISKFIDIVLDVSLILASVAALIPNKITEILKKFNFFISPLIDKGGGKLDDFSLFIKQFIPNIDIQKELLNCVQYIGYNFYNLMSITFYYIDTFLNNTEYGNVFAEIIQMTAAAAFNRSFDSSFGKILGLFFDKVSLEAFRRPNLYNFCKYGSATFKEVSEIEELFRRVAQESVDRGPLLDNDANFSNTGWVLLTETGRGGSAKNYYTAADLADFQNLTSPIHNKYMEAASVIASHSPTSNPFASDNPYESKEYKDALASVEQFMNSVIHVEGFMKQDDSQRGKYFYYKGDKFNEVIKKLDNFEDYFKHSTDKIVRESLKKWKNIKENIEKRKKDKHFPRGTSYINFKEGNEMLMTMMIFVTIKRRQVMEDLRFLDIEFHNFRENSELKTAFGRMRMLHKPIEASVRFEKLSTLGESDSIFKSMLNVFRVADQKYSKNEDYKKYNTFRVAMRDDSEFTGFNIYKLIGKIKSLNDELKRVRYVNNGVRAEDVYFFNNYSSNTDNTIKMMDFADDTSENEFVTRNIDSTIKSTTTNEEMTILLIDEYKEVKKYEKELRKYRSDIISNIIEGVNNLIEKRKKYEEVK